VVSCCCINHGESKIIANFDKESYLPGEKINLELEIDNRLSTAGISKIEA